MKINDEFTIEITGMSDEGDGIGRIDGVVVFAPGALPGEHARVIINKVLKNYAIGSVLEIITLSSERVYSDCEYYNDCGGCQLRHMTYEAELAYKQQKVSDGLRRIGKINAEVLPILGAKSTLNYRNKAQFPVSHVGIGMYADNSHELVDVEKCIIQDEKTVDIVRVVREWMRDFNIAAYDGIKNTGIVRHIYTRIGAEEALICVVTGTGKLPYANELVTRLLRLPLNIVGIIQNVNSKKTNVVLGNTDRILYGRDFIYDNIGDLKIKISANSFYQVNNSQTGVMYDVIKNALALTGSEVIWDLYCGIGTIGLYLAVGAKSVVGVEAVKTAVENARDNAGINGITNAEFHQGLAEEIIPEFVSQGKNADVVIVDPPRKGCDKRLLAAIAELGAERIVYVSCKPSTLARDLAFLADKGYIATLVQPVDMFPGTAHVECVVLMSREGG